MGIMDLLQEIELEGYNASEDVANEFENLPDGEYEGYICDFTYRVNDKGTEWFSFEITIPTENNRKYWANLFLSGKMAKVNLKKMLNYIYKLSGVAMESMDFADPEAGAAIAKEHVSGVFVYLTLKTNKNDFQSFTMERSEGN